MTKQAWNRYLRVLNSNYDNPEALPFIRFQTKSRKTMENSSPLTFNSLMIKILLLLTPLILASCTGYAPPKDADIAEVTVRSDSEHGYIAVTLCEDSQCQKSYRVGIIRGDGFKNGNCSGCSPSSRRLQIEAGKQLYIRAETEITFYKFENLPIEKVEDLITDLAEVATHTSGGKKVTCKTTLAINAKKQTKYTVEHSSSKDNKTCTAKFI